MIADSHIVVRQHDLATICRRCGAEFIPTLPLAVSELTKAMKAFRLEHLRCEGKQVHRG